MKVVNQRDFVAGALFVFIGGAMALGSFQYDIGTGSRMGPGYFPLVASIALAFMGLVVIIGAMAQSGESVGLPAFPLRNVTVVLISVAVFGLSIERLGLFIALSLLVGISALAHKKFLWRTTLISIVVQLVLVTLVFVKLLGISIPLLPPFLAG